MKFIIITMLFLTACNPGSLVEPKPTGLSEKDFALQAYIEDKNLTYCTREKNLEQQTDGYVCAETETKKVYYVPMWAWEQDVKYHFIIYAKSQIGELLENLDYFCEKVPAACKHSHDPPGLDALKEWEIK